MSNQESNDIILHQTEVEEVIGDAVDLDNVEDAADIAVVMTAVDDLTVVVNGKLNKPTSAVGTFNVDLVVDFTNATVQTIVLTNNLTSLVLIGGVGYVGSLDVEMHLIQDPTGSRLLAGSAPNIWFAGGPPVLTITPDKRDIFKFRYQDNTWMEIGRSMNV